MAELNSANVKIFVNGRNSMFDDLTKRLKFQLDWQEDSVIKFTEASKDKLNSKSQREHYAKIASDATVNVELCKLLIRDFEFQLETNFEHVYI